MKSMFQQTRSEAAYGNRCKGQSLETLGLPQARGLENSTLGFKRRVQRLAWLYKQLKIAIKVNAKRSPEKLWGGGRGSLYRGRRILEQTWCSCQQGMLPNIPVLRGSSHQPLQLPPHPMVCPEGNLGWIKTGSFLCFLRCISKE